MEFLRAAVRTAALAALVAGIPSSTQAQEVQWRTDYGSALRESQTKKRPIFIDFTSAGCFWCQRLDSATFSQGPVARMLNERFIPLKLDAQKAPTIVRALAIQRYPTMIFAASNGNILIRHEGFEDAGAFQARMDRALLDAAKMKDPEVAEAEKTESEN